MKILNYRVKGLKRVGVYVDEKVYDLTSTFSKYGSDIKSVEEILSLGYLDELDDAVNESSEVYQLQDIKIDPAVRSPQKIFLAAVNYYSHSKEGNLAKPLQPYLFTKFTNALKGAYDDVRRPRSSSKMDYEGELAVIIGKKCKYVSAQEARSCVAGYTVADDISFRDWQFPPGWPNVQTPYGFNWVMGKMLDDALPLGPWLVTSDELEDPYSLNIKTKVNGEIRQNGSTSDMIFKIEEIIAYLSQGITLYPGDVISTGTPEGVAAFTGERYLKAGDVVSVEIEGIGGISNKIVEE
ncbi:MAG: fumarylacetoacetate hydrolase family protein [Nitrososphaeria archaeon]